MRQIDKLVGHLIRFAGEALVVASGAPVSVQTTAGEKTSNQVLDHASVTSMITEVAPPGCLQELRTGKTTRFIYGSTAMNSVTVEVAPSQGSWKVTFIPGASPGLPRSAVLPEGMPAGGVPSIPVGAEAAIEAMLRAMSQRGASDLHLTSGLSPMLRLHGEIQRADDSGALSPDALRSLLWPIVPKRNREEFERRHDTDFAHEMPGVSRFRVNLFMDRNGIGAVFRRIPFEIIPADRLGLSVQVLELCDLNRGLVLVTGPPGRARAPPWRRSSTGSTPPATTTSSPSKTPSSSCTTTSAASCNQREVGCTPTTSVTRCARRCARTPTWCWWARCATWRPSRSPSRPRRRATWSSARCTPTPRQHRRPHHRPVSRRPSAADPHDALGVAQGGHLADPLQASVGGGRVAAYEVLIGTPAVANLIREGKTFQLPGTMQTSKHLGMVTMADSLVDLVLRGLVEPREAYLKAINKTEIRQLLHNAGVTIPDA
jgi:twitching motility protein PilT